MDSSPLTSSTRRRWLAAGCTILAVLLSSFYLVPLHKKVFGGMQAGASDSKAGRWPIAIDYPEDGSIFPPGITPPTFLWRDAAASSWHIDVKFADKSAPLRIEPKAERMHLGAIDPECVSATNELPSLTAKQAASWTWVPDALTWRTIQLHSRELPATVTITGSTKSHTAVSQVRFSLTTSADPVGAPIFYRDVPLMPSAGANGTVQPLSPDSIHLIRWRLRDILQPQSRTVLTNMPTCANCHSFSGDGKTLGIDVDGPANDKGLYAVVPVARHMSIQNKDVVQWNKDGQAGKARVGFMSQVSPDGRYVVSTFAGSELNISDTYYVTNFKDYRFLQVFYPTRGILEWYDRAAGKRQPLPGADDPHYVQTDGVWSPDGKYIVFARAEAVDPHPAGQPKALHANDPNETRIQYDLYRVPFNNGKGGVAEPIAGASHNGMSNNFPKVSPDGRWIVFVECMNGQLMRPDSQLYIVPAAGGEARRLRSNTPIMNSWHSFSPNGRWLVFSSKARSPYTQMYLTHLDKDGNSSPAILIDNSTASNRAVNIPEFVNTAGNGIEDIQVPAVELYKLIDEAAQLGAKGEKDKALADWQKAAVLEPENVKVQIGLGTALYVHGETAEGIEHLHRAVRINPLSIQSHYVLGGLLLDQGHAEQALVEIKKAIEIMAQFAVGEKTLASADGHSDAGEDPELLDALAAAYAGNKQFDEAKASEQRALDIAIARGNASQADALREHLAAYTRLNAIDAIGLAIGRSHLPAPVVEPGKEAVPR